MIGFWSRLDALQSWCSRHPAIEGLGSVVVICLMLTAVVWCLLEAILR